MSKKAIYILEKIALDFKTTRGLLTAFKAGGGTLARSGVNPQYTRFLGQHSIAIPKKINNPRANFFHEMGHFLDLRKRPDHYVPQPGKAPLENVLKMEQRANIIADKNIVIPEHKEIFKQVANENYRTYKRSLPTQEVVPLQILRQNTIPNISKINENILTVHAKGITPESSKIETSYLKKAIPGVGKARSQIAAQNKNILKQDAFKNYSK